MPLGIPFSAYSKKKNIVHYADFKQIYTQCLSLIKKSCWLAFSMIGAISFSLGVIISLTISIYKNDENTIQEVAIRILLHTMHTELVRWHKIFYFISRMTYDQSVSWPGFPCFKWSSNVLFPLVSVFLKVWSLQRLEVIFLCLRK